MSAAVSRFIVTHHVEFRITGGEVRSRTYSSGEFRVNRVILEWHHVDGKWAPGQVTVRGSVLKKGGDEGTRTASERIWGTPPVWLSDLMDAHAPAYTPAATP